MTHSRYPDRLLREILTQTRTIACVGVSKNVIRPSFFVARYLSTKGFRVIPVNPAYEGETLLGEAVYPSLAAIPAEIQIDMVNIFRRPDQVAPIISEAIEHLLPRGLSTIWMQIGVMNEEAAETAESAGLTVIMDRCPKIEHQRLFGELRKGGFATGIISSKL